MPVSIDIINQSTAFPPDQLAPLVAALQVQVDRDFAPHWNASAMLIAGDSGDATHWQLVTLDNADQAGALGYHETTAAGLPLGKVFAKTTLDDGALVSVVASHELLEMLADPYIDLTVFDQGSNPHSGTLYMNEVCDAVEADQYGYDIDGVTVSDFVLPDWFSATAGSTGPFDFGGHLTGQAPTLLPGGYIGAFDIKRGHWVQLTADEGKPRGTKNIIALEGSRRWRRKLPREQWRRSTR